MKTFLNCLLAVVIAAMIGAVVNYAITLIGDFFVHGLDGADSKGVNGNLVKPMYLLVFLAHTAGSFAGGFVAAKMAPSHKMICSLIVGAFFLLGGIMMVVEAGGPMWFILLDLIVAYIPMSLLAGKLATER